MFAEDVDGVQVGLLDLKVVAMIEIDGREGEERVEVKVLSFFNLGEIVNPICFQFQSIKFVQYIILYYISRSISILVPVYIPVKIINKLLIKTELYPYLDKLFVMVLLRDF